MDVPSRSGDALAQPTRARLFATLAELRRPAPTDELAERLGLHANGIRIHLERLHHAGLVVRDRERRARGRPRDVWAVCPGARPDGKPPTGYAQLARWLVRAIVAGKTGVRGVEATGREIGRELARQGSPVSPERQMHATLVALGFQPRRGLEPNGGLTYCLGNCPYREAVRERQPVVCGLHRGMTRGLLDVIEPRTRLARFVPKDPDTAGCLIEVRGPLASAVAEDDVPHVR